MGFKCIISILLMAGISALYAEDSPFSSRKNEQYRGTTVDERGIVFDYRVLKHYTPEELASVDDKKLKGIHYIYTASYRILNRSACPDFDELDVDIASLEVFRGETDRMVVAVGANCSVNIELVSRKELLEHIHK